MGRAVLYNMFNLEAVNAQNDKIAHIVFIIY